MFDYNQAFSRNIGWLTEDEQQTLRGKRIAIAGLGGVGGSHLLTLARLGIGKFNISDMDKFEVGNFNRQAGAFMSTVDQPKVRVLAGMARDINPELDLKTFERGVTMENMDAFLKGVDLYVDSLDFFEVDIRRAVFAACTERGIPAITTAPVGMGVALLNFLPGKMTFEEYFLMEGSSREEQLIRFMVGLTPAMLQMGYLVDKDRADFGARKVPSTTIGCELCAGVAATNSLKILLGRGKVVCAPRGLHFDAYNNKMSKTWRPGGNGNLMQAVALRIARRALYK
jgi:sulfur-carrier protein adenylyltransferase/sulfurtransferase